MLSFKQKRYLRKRKRDRQSANNDWGVAKTRRNRCSLANGDWGRINFTERKKESERKQ